MRHILLCVLGSCLQALAQTPVVTLTPEWPKLYEQEMITLTCVIQGGGDAEWTYSWQTSSSVSPPDSDSYPMEAEVSHSGFYKCRGQSKGFTTEWSDPFKLEIHNYVPIPVLTVAPIWQSAGAPIMLTCQMEYPSAGWSFYWYEVLQHGRYEIQYTMMPGNGNEENSYVVYMPTSNTTSYVCRAGRGEPMYYSELSERTWAQAGEFGNTINLTTNRPKPETPSVVAALFAGLVSAVVLMVLLMLLYRLLKFPDTNRNRCSTELD
ncbi:Fc receptor 5 [Solea senegalensis]|uniref:Fc receptor 5 n=1 Tax=Solea senegalensis TaxID=28829 RepID=A0AAV6QXL1_SOLSE|nr:Fc receptor 5 [Solea senegalensis]